MGIFSNKQTENTHESLPLRNKLTGIITHLLRMEVPYTKHQNLGDWGLGVGGSHYYLLKLPGESRVQCAAKIESYCPRMSSVVVIKLDSCRKLKLIFF